MSYQKRNNNKQDDNTVGRISLWENFDEKKSYVFSGVVEIDGESFPVYLYDNTNPKNENSPHFYGYIKEPRQKAEKSEPKPRLSKQQATPINKVSVKPVHNIVPDDDEEDMDIQF